MPKIILTIGMPRSGSTWLFNVVRALLAVSGKTFSHGFAEDYNAFSSLYNEGKEYCLIKAHKLDSETIEHCMREKSFVISTKRSVGDSVASQRQMFSAGVVQGAQVILETLACLEEIDGLSPLLLTYEDGFFNKLETVGSISNYLGIEISDDKLALIHEDHLAGNVKSVIAHLSESAPIFTTGHGHVFDENSHWHKDHVKDGAVGKYKYSLLDGEMDFISGVFENVEKAPARFPPVFGYDRRAISSLEQVSYKYAEGKIERCRLKIGPIASFPTGEYEIVIMNNSIRDFLQLDPIVGILAGHDLVSVQPQIGSVTRFRVSVPYETRVKSHYLRFDILSRGWLPLSSILPDSVIVSRR